MSKNKNALKTAETAASFVELEERAAAIYMTLARRFRDNGELSWFWLELSMAEKQHAIVLAFCECQNLGGDTEFENAAVISGLSRSFDNLEARAARRELSVDEAFEIAGEMEASEINPIYERIVRPAQGTSYFTRKKIETLGANHPHILVRAARKFGVSAAVLDKLVRLESEGNHP